MARCLRSVHAEKVRLCKTALIEDNEAQFLTHARLDRLVVVEAIAVTPWAGAMSFGVLLYAEWGRANHRMNPTWLIPRQNKGSTRIVVSCLAEVLTTHLPSGLCGSRSRKAGAREDGRGGDLLVAD